MKKQFLLIGSLISLSFVLMSWGSVGHFKINHDCSLSFDPQMSIFHVWTTPLADHASDADYRKNTDPNESPRHFIDIDDYPEFISSGRIASTLDSLVFIHGSNYVYNHGILPYATRTTYDSLRNCFQRGDWDKAMLFASDLGHYVGDGHMPLHITANYNGYSTGNDGIHSRYESTMISANIAQILYTGDTVQFITDVNKYIFNYIYYNYTYVDSVLLADTYAQSVSSNTSSSQYKLALWNRTRLFTVMLFKNASHSLAELIYTAWVNAGSPAYGQASVFNNFVTVSPILKQVSPNPFSSGTQIQYTVPKNAIISLKISDVNGKIISTLKNGFVPKGDYTLEWTPQNIKSGVYYLILNSGKTQQTRKIVYNK